MKKSTLLYFILLLQAPVFSQNPNWIFYYNYGLINSIAIEKNIIWIGTGKGLVKFNKITEEKTFYNTLNSGLPSNNLYSIAIDKAGIKWIGTDSGLVKFDEKNWTVFNTINSKLPNNYVKSIVIDSRGYKWLVSGGLTMFDDFNWRNYNPSNSELPGWVNCIAIDNLDVLWMGISGYYGLVRFDGKVFSIFNSSNSGMSGIAHSISIDDKDNKWIATEVNMAPANLGSGIVKFDGTNWKTFSAQNFGTYDFWVYAITFDNNGNKWFGTRQGLYKFDDINWTFYKTTNSKLPTNMIPSLISDSNGSLWIGTSNGKLSQLNGENFYSYTISNSGLPNNTIRSIVIDKNNYKWIQPGEAGLVKFDGKEWVVFDTSNSHIPDNWIKYFNVNKDGDVWLRLGSDDKIAKFNKDGCTIFNSSNSVLTYKYLASVTFDEKGITWLSTSKGLVTFDGTEWLVYDNTNSGLVFDAVSCITFENEKIAWIGNGNRLIKFDWTGYTLDWKVYSPENSGMPDEHIVSIIVDKNGIKWILTSKSLIRFDGMHWTKIYKVNSNLPETLISQFAIDSSNNIWTAIYEGLIIKSDGHDVFYYKIPFVNDHISSLGVDKYDNKWIGTSNGLLVFREEGVVTSAQKKFHPIPSSFSLSQNYPNPFNPTTTISYSIPEVNLPSRESLSRDFDGRNGRGVLVTLKVYDVLGREIATLINEQKATGNYEVTFNGASLPSGIYFYRMQTGSFSQTKKFVLLK